MSEVEIKLARIERLRGSRTDPHVRVTFRIERGALRIHVPVDLSMRDYDDTEIMQVARNVLHHTLAELAAQTQHWELSRRDMKRLSQMSVRPKGLPRDGVRGSTTSCGSGIPVSSVPAASRARVANGRASQERGT